MSSPSIPGVIFTPARDREDDLCGGRDIQDWQRYVVSGDFDGTERWAWAILHEPDTWDWDCVELSNVLVNPDAPLNTPPWANYVARMID